LCILIGVGMYSGCHYSQSHTIESADQSGALMKTKSTMNENEEAQLVPISAIKFDGNKLTAGVISFGCTQSADFEVNHAIENGQCVVKINRIKRDVCRRAPFVEQIELLWTQPEDCRELKVVIANPLLITNDNDTIKKRMK